MCLYSRHRSRPHFVTAGLKLAHFTNLSHHRTCYCYAANGENNQSRNLTQKTAPRGHRQSTHNHVNDRFSGHALSQRNRFFHNLLLGYFCAALTD